MTGPHLECVQLPSSKPTVDGGKQVAREVVASGATTVMTYNDLLAIGLMQELQAAEVQVLDQISIVGFDDIFGADFTTPALTTIRSPMADCGAEAAALLLDALHGAGEVAPAHRWKRSSSSEGPAADFWPSDRSRKPEPTPTGSCRLTPERAVSSAAKSR